MMRSWEKKVVYVDKETAPIVVPGGGDDAMPSGRASIDLAPGATGDESPADLATEAEDIDALAQLTDAIEDADDDEMAWE